MALDPQFASTVKHGAAVLSTADSSLTSPTNVVTVLSAGASGMLIDRLSMKALDEAAE